MTTSRILLIDDQWGRRDDPMIPERYGRLPVEWLLESAADENSKHQISIAVARVAKEMPSLALVLLDINFGRAGDRLGVEILKRIRQQHPTLPLLMFTSLDSNENRELVVQCMELGANEYVEKAPSAPQMQAILSVYTDVALDTALYGNSASMRLLRANIARVAFSGETSVLIVGESGTGKELVAQALHRQGPKNQGPFVAKNCAHSDLQLLESELFGHERGSFTGAVAQRKGLIEEADGGVLFLDEIADMPMELQGKLLRTLQNRTYRRLGGSRDLTSHFQLICATNRRPDELIRDGRLREDFYYRIATMTLHTPPLRERADDIPSLAEWFLKRFKVKGGASYPGKRFAPSFLARLQEHSWPGNVRELRNVVERAVILSRTSVIGVEELPEPLTTSAREATESGKTAESDLDDDPTRWPVARLAAELRLAVAARRRVQTYKGNQWKAEFMRLMYPESKAANAKGFEDLIKRVTQGPWGCSDWRHQPELAELIEALRD